MSGHETYERICRIATVLFAEHGYHGVSTRTIAAAADINIATMSYHVGSKSDLYAEVFRRAFLRELHLVETFAETVTDDVVQDPIKFRDKLLALVDALIEMTSQHPETPRLWIRRWLEAPEGGDRIDVEYGLPLYQIVAGWIERARETGTIPPDTPDVKHILISFTWMLYGFFTGGGIDWDKVRTRPDDPEALEDFRTYMCAYICRMLELPE